MTIRETLMRNYSRLWKTLDVPEDTGGPAVPFASTTQCCISQHSDIPQTVCGQEDKVSLRGYPHGPLETPRSSTELCNDVCSLLLPCSALCVADHFAHAGQGFVKPQHHAMVGFPWISGAEFIILVLGSPDEWLYLWSLPLSHKRLCNWCWFT